MSKLVGNKANEAVRNKIANALEHCKIRGVEIRFWLCNLEESAILLLAQALAKNTCVGGFTCLGNPGNTEHAEDAIRAALIATSAPITKWNRAELPWDVVSARGNKNM